MSPRPAKAGRCSGTFARVISSRKRGARLDGTARGPGSRAFTGRGWRATERSRPVRRSGSSRSWPLTRLRRRRSWCSRAQGFNHRREGATESVRGKTGDLPPVEKTEGDGCAARKGSLIEAHRTERARMPETAPSHVMPKLGARRQTCFDPARRRAWESADPQGARGGCWLQTLGMTHLPSGATRAERLEARRGVVWHGGPFADDGDRFGSGDKGARRARANVKVSARPSAAAARQQIEPAEGVLAAGTASL